MMMMMMMMMMIRQFVGRRNMARKSLSRALFKVKLVVEWMHR